MAKIIFKHFSTAIKNPYPLKVWEYQWEYDGRRSYYSNYWVKCKISHSLKDGFQPYIQIYGDLEKHVYVKIFGKQAKSFSDMDQALFYAEKQFDTSVMKEFDFEIFEG